MLILIFIASVYFFSDQARGPHDDESAKQIRTYKDCVEAGFAVSGTMPKICTDNTGQQYEEGIGNVAELADQVIVTSPRPNEVISSPLTVRGEAKAWFFEASFPVVLVDWDGRVIAEGAAEAQGEWMIEDFVPFEVTLEFQTPDTYDNGTLILQKANPSDLPEHAAALEMPVYFEGVN